MVPLRSHVANVFMALVLVIPVMVGAFAGGRSAGIVSAAFATLGFDFFFTVPYRSLRIANWNDIATAIALLLVALIASELGNRLRRADRRARAERAAFDRLCRVVAMSARGADVEDVVSSADAEIMGMFDLDQCEFETAETRTRAVRLGIDGSAVGNPAERADAELVLAPGGVALSVTGRGRDYGQLVLYAKRPVRCSRLEHRIAVSIAEELGLTLARQAAETG